MKSTMRYLIDTYNLLHATDTMGGIVAGMSVRQLCQYLAAGSLKATLVLDGRAKPDEPSTNEFPDIPLVYSGAGVPADTVIAQLIEKAKSRKGLTVVTNDRAVALHARRLFAQAMSCEAFVRLLTEGRAKPTDEKHTRRPTRGETDHWLKEFGLKSDNPEERPRPRPSDDPDDLDIEGLLGPRG